MDREYPRGAELNVTTDLTNIAWLPPSSSNAPSEEIIEGFGLRSTLTNYLDCQKVSNKHGTTPGWWGSADTGAKNIWIANKCSTVIDGKPLQGETVQDKHNRHRDICKRSHKEGNYIIWKYGAKKGGIRCEPTYYDRASNSFPDHKVVSAANKEGGGAKKDSGPVTCQSISNKHGTTPGWWGLADPPARAAWAAFLKNGTSCDTGMTLNRGDFVPRDANEKRDTIPKYKSWEKHNDLCIGAAKAIGGLGDGRASAATGGMPKKVYEMWDNLQCGDKGVMKNLFKSDMTDEQKKSHRVKLNYPHIYQAKGTPDPDPEGIHPESTKFYMCPEHEVGSGKTKRKIKTHRVHRWRKKIIGPQTRAGDGWGVHGESLGPSWWYSKQKGQLSSSGYNVCGPFIDGHHDDPPLCVGDTKGTDGRCPEKNPDGSHNTTCDLCYVGLNRSGKPIPAGGSASCEAAPTSAAASVSSCQAISNKHGTTPGWWGTADALAQASWSVRNCTTKMSNKTLDKETLLDKHMRHISICKAARKTGPLAIPTTHPKLGVWNKLKCGDIYYDTTSKSFPESKVTSAAKNDSGVVNNSSGPVICQSISNKHGTTPGWWGSADTGAKNSWIGNKCSTIIDGTPLPGETVKAKHTRQRDICERSHKERNYIIWKYGAKKGGIRCEPTYYDRASNSFPDHKVASAATKDSGVVKKDSGPVTCQSISNKHGTTPGWWGTADAEAKKVWSGQKCSTIIDGTPLHEETPENKHRRQRYICMGSMSAPPLRGIPLKIWSTLKCEKNYYDNLSNTFQASRATSTYAVDKLSMDAREWLKPTTAKEKCQAISDIHGTISGWWGTADSDARNIWASNACSRKGTRISNKNLTGEIPIDKHQRHRDICKSIGGIPSSGPKRVVWDLIQCETNYYDKATKSFPDSKVVSAAGNDRSQSGEEASKICGNAVKGERAIIDTCFEAQRSGINESACKYVSGVPKSAGKYPTDHDLCNRATVDCTYKESGAPSVWGKNIRGTTGSWWAKNALHERAPTYMRNADAQAFMAKKYAPMRPPRGLGSRLLRSVQKWSAKKKRSDISKGLINKDGTFRAGGVATLLGCSMIDGALLTLTLSPAGEHVYKAMEHAVSTGLKASIKAGAKEIAGEGAERGAGFIGSEMGCR
jgi:hypothetical protein